MEKRQQVLRLLPNYFKVIGMGLLLVSVASIDLLMFFDNYNDLAKEIAKNWIFLSFIILMFSKDKIEDELTIQIRLQSFAAAFIYGVMMIVLSPFNNLLLEQKFILEKGTDELMLGMVFFYFVTYFFLKRKR